MPTLQHPGQPMPTIHHAMCLSGETAAMTFCCRTARSPPSTRRPFRRAPRASTARGKLLLPGLVEAHTHLDKTLWGMGWHPQHGRAAADRQDRQRAAHASRARHRSGAPVGAAGTAFGRQGHARISAPMSTSTPSAASSGIEGVMRTRDKYRDVVDIEIVAFPQSGMLVRPGTRELLDQALAMGADVVGGLDPCAIDRDPRQHLDIVFELAERHGKPVDIHLHEPAELGGFSMELIIERTRALGMQGRVTISHAFCLGMTDRAYARQLMEQLAKERIAVMTHGAPSRPVPPIAECYEMGIVVCAGSDGIRDSWGPYGNGDMLERAMILGLRNNFRRDDEVEMALDVCTYGGAKVMQRDGYGLEVGCDADLVLLPRRSCRARGGRAPGAANRVQERRNRGAG